MTVWLVRGWWYRDEVAKIVGIFATKEGAKTKVSQLEQKSGEIWSYDIKRVKVQP